MRIYDFTKVYIYANMILLNLERKKEAMNQTTQTANQATLTPIEAASVVYLSPKEPAAIQDASADFLAYLDASEATAKTYAKALKVFFTWLTAKGINQPNREDLIQYRRELLETRKATTAASYINALKQFFNWLEYKGIYKNIADHVKGAKLERGYRKDPLTAEQAKELIASVNTSTLEGLRDKAIIALSIAGALRTIEIERANICDLQYTAYGMALFIQGKGKTDKSDFVKIPYQVERVLRDYLAARGEDEPTAPLFASCSDRNSGGRLTTNSISRIVKNALRSCGFDSPRLTAHSLRHTGVTIAILEGSTLQEAQQLARHASINTTMIYNHALDRANNKSEARIAAKIF